MWEIPDRDKLKLIFQSFEETLAQIAADPSANVGLRVQNIESFIVNLGKLLS